MTEGALQIVSLLATSALLVAGAGTALSAANVAKRVVGIVVAFIGAALALASLGAPEPALVGAIALAFGYCVIGVSLLVRLQEGYGASETPEFDSADAATEPTEPGT
jgi:hypothetical protein